MIEAVVNVPALPVSCMDCLFFEGHSIGLLKGKFYKALDL